MSDHFGYIFIATGAAGIVTGIIGKAAWNMLNKGNGKINGKKCKPPVECEMKLDTLIGEHESQKHYMQDQLKERAKASVHLENISKSSDTMVQLLRENQNYLKSIARNGK